MGGAPANYIEDVFSTWLYTGNGTTQTITNGIDLAGKGGLTWIKTRSVVESHVQVDTARGAANALRSNSSAASINDSSRVSAFTASGFTVGNNGETNDTGVTYASWTFREQSKFFDVVTWSGDGSGSRSIPHALGSVPACVIMRSVNTADNWAVFHRGMVSPNATWWQNYMLLDQTQAAGNYGTAGLSSEPTSANLNVASGFNSSGKTFIAYLFAHNAGGFGLSGTDNVISCGSFTCPSSGGVDVNLGYEPQWILTKKVNGAENWNLWDTMRGWAQLNQAFLAPNNSNAEVPFSGVDYFFPTATGFRLNSSFGLIGDYIYIAIRRGPMRTPTTGTSVFYPGIGVSTAQPCGFPADLAIQIARNAGQSFSPYWTTRLTDPNGLTSSSTVAESAGSAGQWQSNTSLINNSSSIRAWEIFRRAPGFFDQVCYTGNDVLRTINHNLGVAPEMMIIKCRDSALDWAVYHAGIGNTKYLFLNSTAAEATASSYWNNTSPTASVFTINTTNKVNSAPSPYVAYLFASCPGVSKVGSFTGTGSTQVINCGFTGGARFVLIKATSTTGNWLVWDTARGMIPSNDPYLALNSTAAEVTGTDWVDTAATGFELSNAGGNLANSNGVSYVFLAIA